MTPLNKKMNLVVDVGNTYVKLGIFDAEGLNHKKSFAKQNLFSVLEEIYTGFPKIRNVLVASVGQLDTQQSEMLERRFSAMHLNQETKVPFTNKYNTPKTLGTDRIALISAASQQFPNQNVLVVDAGTCITYDFINSDCEYLGGAISPGIAMRYQALHSFTARLPHLSLQRPENLVGNSTTDSIHSGVINGVLFEIEGFIDNYNSKFAGLKVILTGGDTHFLRGSLKNDIFANPNFLLQGLNHILEYNIR